MTRTSHVLANQRKVVAVVVINSHMYGGQRQKSNATSDFRRLELFKSLKRKSVRLS